MLKVFKLSYLKTFVIVASPLKCKNINGGIEILFFFVFSVKFSTGFSLMLSHLKEGDTVCEELTDCSQLGFCGQNINEKD